MPPAPLSFDLPDSGATEALGAALARGFAGAASGAIVHMRGELGSGKTTCARSLLHALGVTAPVRSPTYTLVDTYGVANVICVHVDLYRVQTTSEVEETDRSTSSGSSSRQTARSPGMGSMTGARR